MPLFSGEYTSTIDDKNRIILPVRLRQAAGAEGETGYYVMRGIDDCIVIQTAARFGQVSIARSDERVRQTSAGRRLERVLFANAEFGKCDKQGRLLIRASLIQSLRMGREIVIAGVNDRIEVWDKARWAEEVKLAEQELRQGADQVYGKTGAT